MSGSGRSVAVPPMQSRQFACFSTELGWMAVDYDADRLHRLLFGYPTPQRLRAAVDLAAGDEQPPGRLPPWVASLRDRLQEFAAGVPQQFDDVLLADEHLTSFARRVTDACRNLPWGARVTYAELAQRAGRPGAARAVGNVMAANRFPLVVPCHRVVGSGGGLGGYSAPGGLRTKRRLLEAETAAGVPA